MFLNILKSVTAVLSALAMVLTPAVQKTETQETEVKEVINYVSLGASNANGYGLDGYLPEEVEAYPSLLKAKMNVYGYQRAPEAAYPSLIKEALEAEGKTVNLDQLAISSMRAEELRVLLDETYEGDSYTAWRFTGENGWFEKAEEGGLDALREVYSEKIASADLITLDIGVNNFAVYASNRIFNGMYEGTDMSALLSEEEYAKYIANYEKIKELVESSIGEEASISIPEETLDLIVDTFAYALYGYCTSFDAVVEKIYELNPDVDIVVVSIQNLMAGLELTVGDTVIPLGDIYGAVINMANLYSAIASPYADTYDYALLAEDGHITTFLDELKTYDGTVEGLTENIKNCLDIYDNTLYVKERVRYAFVKYLANNVITVTTSSTAEATIKKCLSREQYFAVAYMNDWIVIGSNSAQELFEKAENGRISELPVAYQPYFQAYINGLNAVYCGIATAFRDAVTSDTVDAAALSATNIGKIEDKLMDGLSVYAELCFAAGMKGEAIPEYQMSDNATIKTVMLMGIRNSIGNSFFVHPSAEGHKQIAAAILNAYENDISGRDTAIEKIAGYVAKSVEYADEEIVKPAEEKVEENVKESFEKLEEHIEEKIEEKAEAEAEEVKKQAEEIAEKAAEQIKKITDTVADHIFVWLEPVTDAIADKSEEGLDKVAEHVAEKASEIIDTIAGEKNEAADEVVEEVQEAAEEVIEHVEEKLDEIADCDKEEVVEKTAEIVADAAEKSGDALEEVTDLVESGKIEEAQEQAEEQIEAVKEQIEAGAEAAETVKKQIETVYSKINDVYSGISSFMSKYGITW